LDQIPTAEHPSATIQQGHDVINLPPNVGSLGSRLHVMSYRGTDRCCTTPGRDREPLGGKTIESRAAGCHAGCRTGSAQTEDVDVVGPRHCRDELFSGELAGFKAASELEEASSVSAACWCGSCFADVSCVDQDRDRCEPARRNTAAPDDLKVLVS